MGLDVAVVDYDVGDSTTDTYTVALLKQVYKLDITDATTKGRARSYIKYSNTVTDLLVALDPSNT